jgi:hypothetical protein
MQHVGRFPRIEICALCDIWMVTFMPVFYTLYSHCGPIHRITHFVSEDLHSGVALHQLHHDGGSHAYMPLD